MTEFKKMKEFVDKAVIVYEGAQDFERDMVARSLYRSAIDDIQAWLREKLLDSLKGSDNSNARARIYCPAGGVAVTIGVSEEGNYCQPMPIAATAGNFDDDNRIFGCSEQYYFPYGHVDAFIHKAVMNEAGNPVEMMFSFFEKQLEVLHGYASSCSCGEGVLSESKLCDNSIWDVLGIHCYEPVIRGFRMTMKNAR